MAENMKTNGAESPEGTAAADHNVANIERRLRDAFAETYKLDTKIKADLDKYVAPNRAAKSDIKSKLNKDLNITRKVFAVRYAAYSLEADARAAEDNATLEILELMFSITPVGTQAEMFSGSAGAGNGAEQAPAKSKPKAKKAKATKAAKPKVSRGAHA